MSINLMEWVCVHCCAFLGGMPVTNGISLARSSGICAMDYCSDDPIPNANTRGLIVDSVSRYEEPRIRLLIRSFNYRRSCMNAW